MAQTCKTPSCCTSEKCARIPRLIFTVENKFIHRRKTLLWISALKKAVQIGWDPTNLFQMMIGSSKLQLCMFSSQYLTFIQLRIKIYFPLWVGCFPNQKSFCKLERLPLQATKTNQRFGQKGQGTYFVAAISVLFQRQWSENRSKVLLSPKKVPDILMLAKASILRVMTGNQHMASVSTMKKNLFAKPKSLDVVVAVFRVFCGNDMHMN